MKRGIAAILIALLCLSMASCTTSCKGEGTAGEEAEDAFSGDTSEAVAEVAKDSGEIGEAQPSSKVPWDSLGKSYGEMKSALGDVERVYISRVDATACGFQAKGGSVSYYVYSTNGYDWDVIPDEYADKLAVAGFGVKAGELLDSFTEGMSVPDYLKALGVSGSYAYSSGELGESYSNVSYNGYAVEIDSAESFGEGVRALKAGDWVLLISDELDKSNGASVEAMPWESFANGSL